MTNAPPGRPGGQDLLALRLRGLSRLGLYRGICVALVSTRFIFSVAAAGNTTKIYRSSSHSLNGVWLSTSVFRCSITAAPEITTPSIVSVAYCRTRGTNAYPLLIVRLKHPEIDDFPVRVKLLGFDGPVTVWPEPWSPTLVGTSRYDVLHTMTFPPTVHAPTIVDLLAELAAKWDHTRERIPHHALPCAENPVQWHRHKPRKGSAPLPRVTAEAKSAIVDAFPARRRRMQQEINFRSGDD
ncbi:hypothetical protein DFH07DRAFT_969936 [Mycena maculata]|uniref:Uncharacterized protein n=1 Tax=Mycena maculata TaxID=230809 RepID=A0AAD7MRZ5_9AGAR|nr:hypothetical protein DFH07DRAFT_969936 [Mycena maculata]